MANERFFAIERQAANDRAEAAARVEAGRFGAGADPGGGLAAHVAAADPHPGYLKESDIDTDSAMAANSDTKVASQKAVKTALATKAGKPATAITGSRTDGTALANLLTALAAQGLITDTTTP